MSPPFTTPLCSPKCGPNLKAHIGLWAELIVCLSVSVCLYACVVVFAWGSARDPGKLKQSACTRTRLAWGGVWARGRGGVWRALARPVVSAARAVAGPREPCRGGARLFIFGVARYKNETIDLSVCHSGLFWWATEVVSPARVILLEFLAEQNI